MNYDLFLCDLDVSGVYTSASRCVDPPKSMEDAHMTHGIMADSGEPTLK